MIVADTSALVSLSTVELVSPLLAEFDVHTTEIVLDELTDTAEYEDNHAAAATEILEQRDQISVHQARDAFESSRVDEGEGSCALLANELDADFLVTDDLRALPELRAVTDAQVAISPIVLKALVTRNVLNHADAEAKLEQLARERDWLDAPIYRRARNLF